MDTLCSALLHHAINGLRSDLSSTPSPRIIPPLFLPNEPPEEAWLCSQCLIETTSDPFQHVRNETAFPRPPIKRPGGRRSNRLHPALTLGRTSRQELYADVGWRARQLRYTPTVKRVAPPYSSSRGCAGKKERLFFLFFYCCVLD